MEEEQTRISINIPMGMYKWLEENKTINRSELFRKAVVREQQQASNKVSPLMFLISIMGIVFSVALISIGITPSPMHNYARASLCVLGGFLAFSTSLLYYKERKKIKETGG